MDVTESGSRIRGQRILIFANTLRVGGLERVTVNLANGLANAGHEVALALVSAEGDLLNDVRNEVRIVDFDAGRVLTSTLALRRYIADARPDVCIGMGAHVNGVAGLVTRTMGSPTALVCTHHSILRRMDDGPKRRILHLLVKDAYRRADQVVCVSHGVLDYVRSEFSVPADRGCVIYNPVLDRAFWDRKNSVPGHPWFSTDADVPVILSAGRHAPEKDFRTLVDAFVSLRQEHAARLVLLGDGPERESLTAYANATSVADDIDLPGFVDSVYPYMVHADVFALSSETEGFGMVLVEAMGCGCPVVSTDCHSGPAEILVDGEYGPLVPVGDSERLADALACTLDAPLDAETLRLRAREFSAERSVERYEHLIDDLTR